MLLFFFFLLEHSHFKYSDENFDYSKVIVDQHNNLRFYFKMEILD